MGFFGKSKKDSSAFIQSNEENESAANENENIVYRDGVFEVYEDKNDGKKYGRILKFHGSTKVFPMGDEEFALWSDAADNFSKYRISYERDEDFFIEKAHIELATTPNRGVDGKEKAAEKREYSEAAVQPAEEISDEEKAYRQSLIEFYNQAVKSADYGESMMKTATLDQCFSSSALAERKIIEQINRQKKEFADKGLVGTPAKPLNIELPVSLGKVSEFAKRALYEQVGKLEKVYVLYSEFTKRPHCAGGNALIALSEDTANAAAKELTDRNQKIYIKTVENKDIEAELADIMRNGFVGMRFMHKYGMAAVIQINGEEIKKKIQFPENVALRRDMDNFFQDLRNGVPAEKLRGAELRMYDSLFKATLLQPCVKAKDADGNDTLTVSIIKDGKGSCLLDLYTSVEGMEKSPSYIRFAQKSPDAVGYKRWSFDDMMAEIDADRSPANGFIVDKDNIPAPFAEKALEKVRSMKEIWEKNGKTFIKKEQ